MEAVDITVSSGQKIALRYPCKRAARDRFDELLRGVAQAGVVVSAHPNAILTSHGRQRRDDQIVISRVGFRRRCLSKVFFMPRGMALVNRQWPNSHRGLSP